MDQSDIFHAEQYDSPFSSIIYCPGCNCNWAKHCVPKYCPECGAKVADSLGTGFTEASETSPRPFMEDELNRAMHRMEDFVAFTEKGYVPQTIIQCPRCSYRCPKLPEKEMRICPRCRITMKNVTPLKNILYRMRYYRNELRYRFGI
jgi:uncharacterized paraquat-inducible protein A